ncbi:MAG: response regulator, partial [Candidatus Binatia bacterium]
VSTQNSALRNVLVVDDEESARYVLKRLLSELPIQVAEAASGAEGIRMAAEQQPDMIFLDLKMPGMSGWTVLHSLKGDPATRDIPVIIITSEMPRPDEQAEIERTAQGLIRKNDLTAKALEQVLQAGRNFRYARNTSEENRRAQDSRKTKPDA